VARASENGVPFVAVGMEQWNDLSGFGIDSGNIRSLVMIACEACQTEIAGPGGAPMLDCDDMIDLKWEPTLHL
jgi:hypothetical protein